MEHNILKLAILQLGKMRGNATFCPSEVVRWIFPVDWRYFMDDVRGEMMQLYREGVITVSQKGKPIDPHCIPKGPVRIKLNP